MTSSTAHGPAPGRPPVGVRTGRRGLLAGGFWLAASLASLGALASGRTVPQDDSRLPPEERELLDSDRRHGRVNRTLGDLDELVDELPEDPTLRALRARCRWQVGQHGPALEDAEAARAGAGREGVPAEDAAYCVRVWLDLMTELGRPAEALEALGTPPQGLDPARDGRDAWALGRALAEAGRRQPAREAFRQGADADASGQGTSAWERLLARARCQRRLGFVERAAETLVEADRSSGKGSAEPDVLVELGEVYFEVYGEVDDPVSRSHSPAELAREALTLCGDHEGALLLLHLLHSFNWMRTSSSPQHFLEQLFAAHPDSIRGLLARAAAALDDGNLPVTRRDLERLRQLAPGRRDVRTLDAALAWVEHRREEAEALLEALVAQDPADSVPEREVGWHLLELYRFAEARPFLERAVQRNPRDWDAWTQLGRAQANTGNEDQARESLDHAVEVGEGRRNAWRDNTRLVLKRMAESMTLEDFGELRFRWRPDEGAVLRYYYPEFYGRAREELAARYGHTPEPVLIEVFRRWEDFSVRSTGFQGYPALGVCFGPVVTAVSPLCELRGTFSWARTSFHEFTHVVHLGLSNNRCPRWVTEGLATWEEGTRSRAWWRNMRRDLLDARANGSILPVRGLNNAFRGGRVLFAYFQSGLLCQMLIERNGFPPMVRLLQAFDRGDDLDQALSAVFQRTPEQLDEEFRAYVDAYLGDLAIEPRWSPENTFQLRFRLSRQVPDSGAAQWADDWCRVAWGSYLQGKGLDAEEALRLAGLAGDLPPRGAFLRGELQLAAGQLDQAAASLREGFARGGEDYRARMALGSLLARRGQDEEALQQFQAAERAFPGFDDPHFSAELEQARIHERAGDPVAANQARLRWLAWNSGDYAVRVRVAEWLDEQGRPEESARLWEEANEVDPFRRHLHFAWGQALSALGRHAEARREFEVGLAVAIDLDGDLAQAAAEGLTRDELKELTGLKDEDLERLSPQEVQKQVLEALRRQASENGGRPGGPWAARFHDEEPLLWGHLALEQLELGATDEARQAVDRALALDPGCEPALLAQKRL